MLVRVLFFAVAREKAGVGSAEIDLPEGATVAGARSEIARRFPALREPMAHVRFAVDREFAEPGARLHEGAELAVLPPVSGG